MARRLTPLSKLLITAVAIAIIFFGGRYLLNSSGLGEKIKETAEQVGADAGTDGGTDGAANAVPSKEDRGDADLVVQVFTWGGYAPGFYFNEGLNPNSRSRYQSEYGIKVKFVVIDDFNASRQAWKADAVDLVGATADALPVEMEGLMRYDPKVIMQVDWSRGGDAIVTERGINSANDLRGKKIAYTPGTPSQTFLIKSLDAAGLTLKDITPVEMPDNFAAAAAFKSKEVAAAVVWSPDDQECLASVPGSKVLQSTKQASNIIADVFVAKKKFTDENAEIIRKFYEGWMIAAAEINSNASNKVKASKIFAEELGVPADFADLSVDNVRFTNHGDNQNFFGLNSKYTGVSGSDLYTTMGSRFEELGFAAANRPNWRSTAYSRAVTKTSLTGAEHNAEGQKNYSAPTEADKRAPAIAAKPLSITFATGASSLDGNAKTLIDAQFADIIKSYSSVRIRVEGNTDNVGGAAMNKSLSLKRAQSVVNYLKTTYNLPQNRLIVVGNGPDKPVKGCETNATDDCRAKNRRTELQLVNS